LVYWSVAGLGVAYARLLAPAAAFEARRPARYQPAGMRNKS